MNKGMKKRWISLYVENQVGVLSKISGLFSAKSYNLDSLTVGTTEDPTVSRMTIATVSDEKRCSCEADERGIRQDRSRARRKRRYRVDQCDGAVKERTFLRERKEYYHNYVKKD